MGDMADMLCERDPFDDDEFDMNFWRPRNPRTFRPSGPGRCPECRGPTEVKSGPHGKFYGCVRFPECSGSRNYVFVEAKKASFGE